MSFEACSTAGSVGCVGSMVLYRRRPPGSPPLVVRKGFQGILQKRWI